MIQWDPSNHVHVPLQTAHNDIVHDPYDCRRVRIALGLKPLALENDADKRKKEAQAREAQRAEEAKAAKAAELAERVKACVPLLIPVPQSGRWRL